MQKDSYKLNQTKTLKVNNFFKGIICIQFFFINYPKFSLAENSKYKDHPNKENFQKNILTLYKYLIVNQNLASLDKLFKAEVNNT